MFDAEIIRKIKERLVAANQTVAVAESVTAGLLQAALASAVEAAGMFQGGITAYNIGQKCRHLDINPIHALSCNCVSEKMAQDMAVSASKLFTSDWGIGITGYATPVPESDNRTFAYFSIAINGAALHTERIDTIGNQPLDVQLKYVNTVLVQWLHTLEQQAVE